MASTNGHNGDETNQRLNELEWLSDALASANRHLLTAHVIIHDRQDTFEKQLLQLIERQTRTDAQISATDAQIAATGSQIAAVVETQKAQDERVDKLVGAIGELIRRMPASQA